MIVSWQGSIETIPDGWALCDGNDGRPDLKSNFILGASPVHPPSTTGGWPSHVHPFAGDGHQHGRNVGDKVLDGPDYFALTDSQPAVGTTRREIHLPPWYSLAFIIKL